jgi:glyoxylase-like metal-dependent hydrolase (beta-lactamase superfamily II)
VETTAGARHLVGMTLAQLPTTIRGLHASDPAPLPFAPALQMRSFLLEREGGNLLVYGSTKVPDGDVWRQYLGHGHESAFVSPTAKAPVFVHAADRAETEQQVPVRAAFSRRHTLDDDFEVIPMPGHTPGSTAYLWDSGEHRFLFTADTIFLRDGEWRTAVLDSSDRDAYRDSLALIRELDFDVLVPWIASGPHYAFTDRANTRRRIDALIERITRKYG